MPSKPLLGMPVVVGMSEAVMAMRSVVSACATCQPNNVTMAATGKIRKKRMGHLLSRECYAASMQVADQIKPRREAGSAPRGISRSSPKMIAFSAANDSKAAAARRESPRNSQSELPVCLLNGKAPLRECRTWRACSGRRSVHSSRAISTRPKGCVPRYWNIAATILTRCICWDSSIWNAAGTSRPSAF